MKAFKSAPATEPHPAFASPPAKAKHQRVWVDEAEYNEVLNLVRNTLKKDERAILMSAGYSKTNPADAWRKSGRFPLVAVNALRGLLLGHELAAAAQSDGREPLKLGARDLEVLCQSLITAEDAAEDKQKARQIRQLRAGLHRELARRLEV